MNGYAIVIGCKLAPLLVECPLGVRLVLLEKCFEDTIFFGGGQNFLVKLADNFPVGDVETEIISGILADKRRQNTLTCQGVKV